MKNYCEICDQKNLPTVLDLGKHPLCDDLIKIGSKKKNKLYKIQIIFCKKCVTAYQKHQVKKKILFPPNYHYRAKLTKDVLKGMEDLVKDCKQTSGSLKSKVVLDIGCNDGSLLDIFSKNKAITLGVEPTDAYKEARRKGHKVFNNYMNVQVSKQIKKKYPKIDIITFTNVFAHIEDLKRLIANLKKIISSKTLVIIENHYLGSILKKKQFDTFYHEHPRTYSFTSFLKISELLNMKILKYNFPGRYGGNIRVFYYSAANKIINYRGLTNKEKNFYKDIKKINFFVNFWKKNKSLQIAKLYKKFGPLPAKAFPGRAAILLKILNLKKNYIDCIYEKENSNKIGNYAPGTKIPIYSDRNLKKIDKKKPIINLAWHIKNEIKHYLKRKNIKNKLINIIDQRDFRT